MSTLTSNRIAAARGGLSAEMRRFSAGIRVVVAMLCTVLLISTERSLGIEAVAALLVYDVWAAGVLWAEARSHPPRHLLLHYWIDVVWALQTLHLVSGASSMLIVTLVQPVVLASIAYGVRHGVLLAICAAVAVVVNPAALMTGVLHLQSAQMLPALAVLILVPAAAALARPMNVLQRHRSLVAKIEADFDPRRGLDAMAAQIVDTVRQGTGAQVAGIVLPTAVGAPAWLSTSDDGSFSASPETHRRIEELLLDMPAFALSFARRHGLGWLGGTRLHGERAVPQSLSHSLDALAEMLQVRSLIVVPLTRYGNRHGHLLLGLHEYHVRAQDVEALAQAAPELLRLVENAAIVDRLQDESAAHERARIGRDLHDSAIQPYLGLKYAVESVAMRVAADNPARAHVDELMALVNAEVDALRELIGGMRSGERGGDNALVPAVRRQVRRFALLFNIEVHVSSPDQLPTSRALAGTLFHMVNEALNNVRKHSPARQVWLTIETADKAICLRVRDDAGTVLGRPMPDFRPVSLNERAAELGGHVTLTRPDGLNTELVITIPT